MCGAPAASWYADAFASATADDPGTLLGAARGLATPDQVSYAPARQGCRPDRVRIHDPMRCALVIAIVAVAMPVACRSGAVIHGTVPRSRERKAGRRAIVTVPRARGVGRRRPVRGRAAARRYVVEVSAPWLVTQRRAIVLGRTPLELVLEVDPARDRWRGRRGDRHAPSRPARPGSTRSWRARLPAAAMREGRAVDAGGRASQAGSAEVVVWGAAPAGHPHVRRRGPGARAVSRRGYLSRSATI